MKTKSDVEIGELFTVPEAAQILGVSKQTVYNLMDDGQLEFVLIRKNRRIEKKAIVELIAVNRQGGWNRVL